MLIINKSPGLITIGECHVPQILPGDLAAMHPERRKAHEERVRTAHGAVELRPGPNEVAEQEWAKITDKQTGNKVVLALLDEERIVAKGGVVALKDIKDAGEAVALVGMTGDMTLLARWREGETRKKVVAAIDAQVALIEKALATANAEAESGARVS